MVRNYTRKSNRSSWNEENLKSALEQVKSNAMSVKKASNIYSIPRTTLTRHLKNKIASPKKINLGCFRTVFFKRSRERSCEIHQKYANSVLWINSRCSLFVSVWLCNLKQVKDSIQQRKEESWT